MRRHGLSELIQRLLISVNARNACLVPAFNDSLPQTATGLRTITFGENQLKIRVHHPRQALVHKDRIVVAKQRFAPFLNPHVRFLRAINHEAVNFADRLIENAGGLENRPVVHADDQGAVKLIEVEFDEVLVRVANLQ